METKTFQYPAKLLLFGEHTVLNGSQALAMPLWTFSGSWHHSKQRNKQGRLPEFAAYLKTCTEAGLFTLDTEGVKRELEAGLYFESNIPHGYGIGSSGALVAAMYRIFGTNRKMRGRLTSADLPDLQRILGIMESYFHGSSSGFDPLVSYLKKPVLIKKDRSMAILQAADTEQHSDIRLFLVDSQLPRMSDAYIRLFKEKCQQTAFFDQVNDTLIPYVDDAIASFLNPSASLLFESVHNISHWQYRFFAEGIPDSVKTMWLAGLGSDIFKLKLCGAGGGGYMLGFCRPTEGVAEQIEAYHHPIIWL